MLKNLHIFSLKHKIFTDFFQQMILRSLVSDLAMTKLEAKLYSDILKVFELKGIREYLGFAYIEKGFTEQDIKNTAIMLYSRTVKNLKKVPKIEIEVIYQN